MSEDSYLVVTNLGSLMTAVEKVKTSKWFLRKEISFFDFLKRRVEISRLSYLVSSAGTDSRNLESKEVARCRRTILYAVQDWALFGFRKKSLQTIIKE